MIRYDKPGCGLSDRDGADLSFEGQVAAALAVADATGAERFRLFGASQGGQLAAALAARYPDRVVSDRARRPWDHAADVVTILLPPGMPWSGVEATLRAAAPAA